MVNDARIAIGKNPIGFINPTVSCHFYPSIRNDVKCCYLHRFIRIPLLMPLTTSRKAEMKDVTLRDSLLSQGGIL